MHKTDLMAYLLRLDFDSEAQVERYRDAFRLHPDDKGIAFLLSSALHERQIIRKILHDVCAILEMIDS